MIRPALVAFACLVAPSLAAAAEMTKDELLEWASDKGYCTAEYGEGFVPVAAVYEPAYSETPASGKNTVKITCEADEATGFVPLVGAAGGVAAGGAVLAVAAIAGGGGDGNAPPNTPQD